MKKRVAIIGAGLCGSVVAALLRNDFHVTVIEQGKKKQPLFDDVDCETGELNTSINRAKGLGGDDELLAQRADRADDHDLAKAGIAPATMRALLRPGVVVLPERESPRRLQSRARANVADVESDDCKVAHMVLPQARYNVWELANERYPGDKIAIVYGHAERIVPGADGAPGHVEVKTDQGTERISADHIVVASGGIGTPIILAKSLGRTNELVPGYHDHPQAYVAKLRLKPDSRLKKVASQATLAADVRAGLVYTVDDLKTVIYLRPRSTCARRRSPAPRATSCRTCATIRSRRRRS